MPMTANTCIPLTVLSTFNVSYIIILYLIFKGNTRYDQNALVKCIWATFKCELISMSNGSRHNLDWSGYKVLLSRAEESTCLPSGALEVILFCFLLPWLFCMSLLYVTATWAPTHLRDQWFPKWGPGIPKGPWWGSQQIGVIYFNYIHSVMTECMTILVVGFIHILSWITWDGRPCMGQNLIKWWSVV